MDLGQGESLEGKRNPKAEGKNHRGTEVREGKYESFKLYRSKKKNARRTIIKKSGGG